MKLLGKQQTKTEMHSGRVGIVGVGKKEMVFDFSRAAKDTDLNINSGTSFNY